MIKSENGNIEMRGELSEISADLTIILIGFRKSVGEEEADALIEDAVRLSKLTPEEIDKEIEREKENIKKIIEGLSKKSEKNRENGNDKNRN